MSDMTLSRTEIIELLTELGTRLDERGVRADLFVVGGAAIALAYDTRRMTRDVDGIFEPKKTIYEVAEQLASDRGIENDWLNDAVKGLLPGPDPQSREILNLTGLRVSVPSPEYLLALKVQAARIDRDADDILMLAREVGATTPADVLRIAETVIGPNRLLPKAQFFVEELFNESQE